MSLPGRHQGAQRVRDPERAAAFCQDCLGAEISEPYRSLCRPGFVSRFASLPGGLRVEIMAGPWIPADTADAQEGWDHIALSLDSRNAIDRFAADCATKGFLAAPPQATGDGFYDAIVQAPDGFRVELTA